MANHSSQLFQTFIKHTEILIVDRNVSSVNRLVKILVDLGAKRGSITNCATFDEALQVSREKRLGIVISEYEVGGGSGFDLLRRIRSQSKVREISLILLTSNHSQMAVATSAEEDIDSYILKPFTIQSIKDILTNTISEKLEPSPYVQLIEKAKAEILTQNYDAAVKFLKEAKGLHAKPSLALFYLGQVELLLNKNDEAQSKLTEGLVYNEIHFKCLWSLYLLLESGGKHSEAYLILKKIVHTFPADEGRLMRAIRLAISTENTEDISDFYTIFTSLDKRTDTLVRHISAGLYISGKVHLKNGNRDSGVRCFENITIAGAHFTHILGASVSLLVSHDMAPEAETLLRRFPVEAKDKSDYLVADYILSSKLLDTGALVKAGLNLYNNQIRDQRCMEILLAAMEHMGCKESQMAPIRNDLRSA